MAPAEQAHYSPEKDAHAMAREWAESTLMTDHLVCHTSRWMMTFHESFLDNTVARLVLETAFTSAARALQYAATEIDVQYIYILPVSQCQIVDQMAYRTTIPETLTRAIGMGAVLVDIGSIPTDHPLTHIPPLPISTMRPLALETDDPLRVNIYADSRRLRAQLTSQCSAHTWQETRSPR